MFDVTSTIDTTNATLAAAYVQHSRLRLQAAAAAAGAGISLVTPVNWHLPDTTVAGVVWSGGVNPSTAGHLGSDFAPNAAGGYDIIDHWDETGATGNTA